MSAWHDLTGHVALVTGGNGGIGFGMARGPREAGATVVIWGTNAAKNETAVAELTDGARAPVGSFTVDVSDGTLSQPASRRPSNSSAASIPASPTPASDRARRASTRSRPRSGDG